MRTIAVVAILCACFMQEVSGELPSATPEIKEEAVTHLTEKKVEKSAEEVKADEEEAAEKAQEAAEEKEYDAKAEEFKKLYAKGENLAIEADKDGASNTTKTAAAAAAKEYTDAVQMFEEAETVKAKAEEAKADEKEAAEKAKEAATQKEFAAKGAELEKLQTKAEKLVIEAEKDGASNTTKTAADEAHKEYVDAVQKFEKEMEAKTSLVEEDEDEDS